jgi:hypothetical protein
MQTNRYLVTVQRAEPEIDSQGAPVAPTFSDPPTIDIIRFERALESQLSECPVLRRCLPVQIDVVDNQAPQSATFLVRFAGDCDKTVLAFVVDGAVAQKPLQGAVKAIP